MNIVFNYKFLKNLIKKLIINTLLIIFYFIYLNLLLSL
jgi:hypothetical protein